jgi:hypothetical protein
MVNVNGRNEGNEVFPRNIQNCFSRAPSSVAACTTTCRRTMLAHQTRENFIGSVRMVEGNFPMSNPTMYVINEHFMQLHGGGSGREEVVSSSPSSFQVYFFNNKWRKIAQ